VSVCVSLPLWRINVYISEICQHIVLTYFRYVYVYTNFGEPTGRSACSRTFFTLSDQWPPFCFSLYIATIFYFVRCKILQLVCMCVCLSVCLSVCPLENLINDASKFLQIFRKCIRAYMLPMVMARSSSDGNAIRYALPVVFAVSISLLGSLNSPVKRHK